MSRGVTGGEVLRPLECGSKGSLHFALSLAATDPTFTNTTVSQAGAAFLEKFCLKERFPRFK